MQGDWTVSGYSHIRELGEGSTGRVVLALHEDTDTPVAIKYFRSPRYDKGEFAGRFAKEARLLADIRQPQLVRFLQYVDSPDGCAVVMELVNGASLAELIKSDGPIRPEAALTMLKCSLLALSAAHQGGVVHRDYKPANVLVRGDGTSKLTDTGVAMRMDDQAPAAGTPAYMAPELWEGRAATPATDLYAAVAVLHESLTGARPFQVEQLSKLAQAHRFAAIPLKRIPEPLRDLVSRGMAKDPGDRPASAAEFAAEVDAVAIAAYGDDWQERGEKLLAQRAGLLAIRPAAPRPAERHERALEAEPGHPAAALAMTEPFKQVWESDGEPAKRSAPVEPPTRVDLVAPVVAAAGAKAGANTAKAKTGNTKAPNAKTANSTTPSGRPGNGGPATAKNANAKAGTAKTGNAKAGNAKTETGKTTNAKPGTSVAAAAAAPAAASPTSGPATAGSGKPKAPASKVPASKTAEAKNPVSKSGPSAGGAKNRGGAAPTAVGPAPAGPATPPAPAGTAFVDTASVGTASLGTAPVRTGAPGTAAPSEDDRRTAQVPVVPAPAVPDEQALEAEHMQRVAQAEAVRSIFDTPGAAPAQSSNQPQRHGDHDTSAPAFGLFEQPSYGGPAGGPYLPEEPGEGKAKGRGGVIAVAAGVAALLLIGGGVAALATAGGADRSKTRSIAAPSSPAEPSGPSFPNPGAPSTGQQPTDRTHASTTGMPNTPGMQDPAAPDGTSSSPSAPGHPGRGHRPGTPAQSQAPGPQQPATRVSDVSIKSWVRNGDVGTVQVTVTTTGPGPIDVAIGYTSAGKPAGSDPKQESGSKSYTFVSSNTFSTPCEAWTVTVTAKPGNVTRTATIAAAQCPPPGNGTRTGSTAAQ